MNNAHNPLCESLHSWKTSSTNPSHSQTNECHWYTRLPSLCTHKHRSRNFPQPSHEVLWTHELSPLSFTHARQLSHDYLTRLFPKACFQICGYPTRLFHQCLHHMNWHPSIGRSINWQSNATFLNPQIFHWGWGWGARLVLIYHHWIRDR